LTAFDEIVDRIYQATTEPDIWPGVLHDVGASVDAIAVGLITARNDQWVGWRFAANTPPGGDAYLRSAAAANSEQRIHSAIGPR
jgi:hypothetical protein